MTLAVTLDPVGADEFQALPQVLGRQFAAEFGVGGTGVQVVVDAEEDVVMPVARARSHGWHLGGVVAGLHFHPDEADSSRGPGARRDWS
jgi:hypothetical protein